MADEIRADYDQLGQVASRFGNQAHNIQALLQNVRGKMDDLHDNGWQGQGSEAFFNEMGGSVLPAIQKLEKALTDASEVTNQVAQTVRHAEEEASSVFRNQQ